MILNFKNVLYVFDNDFNFIFIKVLFKNDYFIKNLFNEIKVERDKI